MGKVDAGSILFFIAILLMGLGCGGRAGVRGGPPVLPYEWKQMKTVDLRDAFTKPINSVLDKLPAETAPLISDAPREAVLPAPADLDAPLADVASAAPRKRIQVILMPRAAPAEELGALVDSAAVFAVIAKRAEAPAVVPVRVRRASRIPAKTESRSPSAAWMLFAYAGDVANSMYRAQSSQPALGIMLALALIAITIRPRPGRLVPADSLAPSSSSPQCSTRGLAPLPATSQRTRTPRQ